MLARHKDAFALSLCPHFAALSRTACGVHGGGRGELSAVQLPALCATGAYLPALRSRQPILRAECARIRRGESLRRAGARYQRSYHGACRHAARQRVWRARQTQKVTHQGSAEPVVAPIVAATSITPAGTDADHTVIAPPFDRSARPLGRGVWFRPRCCFCRRPLSRFARVSPLRGGP